MQGTNIQQKIQPVFTLLFNVSKTAENGNVFINEDDLIPVIVKASTEIHTNVKGYVYKNIWKPTANKELETKMEPDNAMDKYAV